MNTDIEHIVGAPQQPQKRALVIGKISSKALKNLLDRDYDITYGTLDDVKKNSWHALLINERVKYRA